MKRMITSLAIAAICSFSVLPMSEAQTRGQRPSSHQPTAGRPSSSATNRPSAVNPGHNSQRPGSKPGVAPGSNNSNNRPGAGTRPQPGVGHQPVHQPQPGHHPTHQPGHQPQPGHVHQPGHGPRPGHAMAPVPPHRQAPVPAWRPVGRPWVAPRPPMGWRPGPIVPTFSTVLGITLGTAFNISLNQLLNNGYTVASYGNDVVNLSNVNQLNMLWPEATLYYGNGGLSRGEFIYYTPYYDTIRYNTAYSRLVAAYGNPVSTSYPDNGMQTCWFGPDGRFVTLTYVPAYGNDGILRYFTTLSFGY